MGIGTLHEYLLTTREMEAFDLDMAVYVFFENDPRDNLKALGQKPPRIPYALLTQDGDFLIDNSFLDFNLIRKHWLYPLYDYVMARSLLMSTLRLRLDLLFEYGIKPWVTDKEMTLATRFKASGGIELPNGGILPDGDDLPSTWPEASREYARKLCEAIILRWREEVEAGSKNYVIMYVPRYVEWRKPTRLQDSWKPWLKEFSLESGIDFIDPYEELLDAERRGAEILYDYLTVSGHKAFAKGFVNWFEIHYRPLLKNGHI